MGIAMIMFKVKSPMLVAIGMYLPIGTTSAIFLGGVIRWLTDKLRDRRSLNEAQKARVENTGILAASGLIAGEALAGLVTALFNFEKWPIPAIFMEPTYVVGAVFIALIAFVLVKVPLSTAGDPNEPAPPIAIV
jgi:hypothetical protein